MNPNVQDVSDPLKHLLSLDFSRTSPLLNEISLDADVSLSSSNSPKRVTKVKFADPFAGDFRSNFNQLLLDDSQIKGILKKKLSLEESEYALSNLNLDDYSDDYSEISSDDESSVDDENEFSEVASEEVTGNDKNNLEEHMRNISIQNDFNMVTNEIDLVGENSEIDRTVNLLDNDIQTITKSDSFKQDHQKFEKRDGNSADPSSSKNGNQNILNILSKIKAKSAEIHRKNGPMNTTDCPTKKPTFHLCVVSLSKQDLGPPKKRNFQSSKLHSAQLAVLNDRLKTGFQEELSFSASLTSKQTLKLQSLLKENTIDVFSAKELRSAVFNAWNKIKSAEKSAKFSESKISKDFNLNIVEKQKTVKSSVSEKGYMYWRKRKELSLKSKRHLKAKTVSTTRMKVLSEEEKRQRNEERELAYKYWKQKKDEQISSKLQKECQRARLNKANTLKQEEIRKKDAASAFHAWKAMKLNFQVQKQEQLKNNPVKINEQKSLEEKAERDKESQDAYFLWLQQKEKLKQGLSVTMDDRPPWNPPG